MHIDFLFLGESEMARGTDELDKDISLRMILDVSGYIWPAPAHAYAATFNMRAIRGTVRKVWSTERVGQRQSKSLQDPGRPGALPLRFVSNIDLASQVRAGHATRCGGSCGKSHGNQTPAWTRACDRYPSGALRYYRCIGR